jgi:hypothetical protein
MFNEIWKHGSSQFDHCSGTFLQSFASLPQSQTAVINGKNG